MKVPSGLQKAVQKARKHIDGRYVYGLPHYGLNTKMKFKLVELGDLDLFEENDIDLEENPNWLPFAVFKDEPQFLAISTQAPHPVSMWEHEDGKFYTVWSTFDDFVSKVIDKKDKTPFEKLEKQLDKISELVDKDAHADALGMLDSVLASFPKLPPNRSFEDDNLARAHNLHGLALKGVKRWAEARTAFEAAAAAGETYADLNILSLLEDEKNPRGVIEYGVKLRDHYLDDYTRVWLSRYLGFAYLDIGDDANAEAELRRIVDGYAISDAAKVAEARKGLEEYIAENRPGVAKAREFLEWFKPRSYDVPPEQAKDNRAWWKALPEGMRAKLMEEIHKEGEDATDEHVARCMDVDSLRLDEDDGTLDDKKLPLLLKLQRITDLGFYGDPDSIELLRQLPKLESLTINNDVIKDFAWPSRANRDLWKAAEAANRKGIEKALAAGASLNSRGDQGESALMMVAGNHDVGLCKHLIAKGADPWAGSYLDAKDIFYFFGKGAESEALEAAAAQAGITHPEHDPYRALDVEHMPSGATFELQTELDLELDDGVPLADTWPSNVKLIMEPPKKDNKLYDVMRLKYDVPVVSERVAEVLRDVANVELLPVTLLDHAKKPRPEKYFIMNPLAKDCLVIGKCHPQWNHINNDSVLHVAAMVIDPARTGGAQMFRPDRLNTRPTILTKELAEKLKDFGGARIRYLPR